VPNRRATLEAGQLNHEHPALSESIGMTAELLEGVFHGLPLASKKCGLLH
jgi:hypothetical protein